MLERAGETMIPFMFTISAFVLIVALIAEYEPGSRTWRSEHEESYSKTEYSGLKGSGDFSPKPVRHQKNVDKNTVDMLLFENKQVGTLAEIVRTTAAPAFVQKLVDTITCEARNWQHKQTGDTR